MERADELLGAVGAAEPAAKRGPDSPDDFEHLLAAGESPQRAAHALLEAERHGPPPAPPAAPPAAPLQPPPLAERFTDSESDAESPLHRARSPAAATAAASLLMDAEPPPAPLGPPLVPAPAPAPPEPAPAASEPPQLLAEPAPPRPQPKPEPAPAPAPPEPKLEPKARPAPPAHVIEAEVIFCRMGLDAWFDPQRLHPEVESLIYWRCPARSGAALGAGLALLVALAACSAVSVLAHAALLALAAAVAFRVYKSVLQAVQKTNDGHPFKALLEADISVGAERAQALAASATAHLNAAAHELRRLFLVEDLVDSLKFGVLLWCLTYVGACFNGITLLILGWVALFSLPKAYEMNKAQVDANLELARAKINEITAKVRAAVPLGKKPESDKEK